MKKNILVIVPALMPSVNIGIINPMQFLQQKGKVRFQVTLPYLFKSKMLDDVDCVIFCRNSFPSEEWILNEVVSRSIPYIYEIDDNFFEIPYDNLLGRNHRHPINLSSLINFISHASVVRTYSHFLAEDAGFYNKNIEINKVYFDFELIEGLKQNKSDKLKIVYATSRMADAQQDIFTEALHKIATSYQDKVEVYFFGAAITDKKLKNLKNVFHLAPIYNYEKFIKKFYEMGFDIGLAPIFEGRFFNSKTNNKYREYGACKIAGIYSHENLYSDCVIDKENGLLVANSPDEWYKTIEKLVTNKELREKIINNAYSDMKQNYSFEHYCDVWMDSIQKATSHKLDGKGLESYFRKDSYIECFLLEDEDLKNEKLVKLKQSLLANVYCGTSIGMVSKKAIDIQDMYKSNIFLQNQQNIILLSDNREWIKYFCNTDKKKNNFIVLTSLNEDICKEFKNIHCISITHENLGIFEIHHKNIYIKIDYLIKKVFHQQQKPSYSTKLKSFIVNKMRNNWLVRKVMFLISKKNSIKLRLYTWWKIYRINRG